MNNLIAKFILASAFIAVGLGAHAHDDTIHVGDDEVNVEVIISSMVDSAGQPIAFPSGPGKITIALITVGPDGVVDWHIHENPLAAYVLEGQLSIDYGSAGVKVFNAGDGIVEAISWPHRAEVSSQIPVKLIAFFAGDEDTPNSIPVEAPAK